MTTNLAPPLLLPPVASTGHIGTPPYGYRTRMHINRDHKTVTSHHFRIEIAAQDSLSNTLPRCLNRCGALRDTNIHIADTWHTHTAVGHTVGTLEREQPGSSQHDTPFQLQTVKVFVCQSRSGRLHAPARPLSRCGPRIHASTCDVYGFCPVARGYRPCSSCAREAAERPGSGRGLSSLVSDVTGRGNQCL